ncbi:Zadh2 [Scenedesmus sp. PABB004]|nr:Zadh2 [Scenedesmus sp. PABB004]
MLHARLAGPAVAFRRQGLQLRAAAGAGAPAAPAAAMAGADDPAPAALPATYRRLIARRTGRSFREVAEVVEEPLPQPGPGEVLIRMRYAGINGGCETFRARGEHAFAANRAKPAYALGAEGAGEVAALGPGVTGLAVGQAVACNSAAAFAEYGVTQAVMCTPVPAATPEAVALSLSAVTAAAALESTAGVQPGEVVVVTAAAGGTGHFAVQLAALAGARVVAVTGSAAKAARLRGLPGVERVVDHSEEDLGAVLAAEYPAGVDVVYEGVGGALRAAIMPALAPGARVLQVGYISEYPHTGRDAAAAVEEGLPLSEVFWKGRTLELPGGRRVFGQVWPKDVGAVRAAKRRVFALHAEGRLDAWVDTSHGYAGVGQVADAIDYMLQGGHVGKGVHASERRARRMTAAPGAAAAVPAGDAELPAPAELEELSDVATLHQVRAALLSGSPDAGTRRAAAPHVRRLVLRDAGLGHWPPALSLFTRLESCALPGSALTFVPQSVTALTALRRLDLSRNALTSVPPEVGSLGSLTELDVGRNALRALPGALCRLTGLRALNAYGNELTDLPADFGALTRLSRLGLKSNRLAALPGSFTQLTGLVELFLTDNALTTLPEGFGQLRSLVKLQASFNPFESLPADLFGLPELELFRLAVGHLAEWPAGLGEAGGLPKLAWCSLGRNPAARAVPALPAHLPRVRRAELEIGAKLGQGASGEVFVGRWAGREVAVKIFLSHVSPDGSTADETGINAAVDHPNLTRVLALVLGDGDASGDGGGDGGGDRGGGGGEGVVGMVLELVHGAPLAGRPTSEHLLRCKWADGAVFSPGRALAVARGVAGALAYLHARGLAHGDVYAHNIMLAEGPGATAVPVLCDFGAAFAYDGAAAGCFFEAMEVRAFGLLLADIAARLRGDGDGGAARGLGALVACCLDPAPARRPRFAELEASLARLAEGLAA